MKITIVPTMTGEEVAKVIELLNHGEDPDRIADVEGFDLDMVRNIARLVQAKAESTIVH